MDKKCEVCENFFYVRPSHWDLRSTCSRNCRAIVDSRLKKGVARKSTWNKLDNPDIAKKISLATKNKINIGNLNGMKKDEARLKASKTRKNMMKDISLRKSISEKVKMAWADGKFDGVNVGRCKWYSFVKNDGEIIKVQGKWELAFVRWAEDNNLRFKSHKDRIPYKDSHQNSRSYYPDFFVFDWESYVDVKNDFHYNLQIEKFDCIRKSNPDLKLLILKKDDLIKLGVVL
jgi:hypothetical protein